MDAGTAATVSAEGAVNIGTRFGNQVVLGKSTANRVLVNAPILDMSGSLRFAASTAVVSVTPSSATQSLQFGDADNTAFRLVRRSSTSAVPGAFWLVRESHVMLMLYVFLPSQ